MNNKEWLEYFFKGGEVEEPKKETLQEKMERAKQIGESELSQYEKDVELAKIMTELEHEYNIPIIKNEKWEQQNREVIDTYRAISNMRMFEEDAEPEPEKEQIDKWYNEMMKMYEEDRKKYGELLDLPEEWDRDFRRAIGLDEPEELTSK